MYILLLLSKYSFLFADLPTTRNRIEAVADNPSADELTSAEFTRKQEGIAKAKTSLVDEIPPSPMMRIAVPATGTGTDTDTSSTPTPAAKLSPPSMIKENKGIALSYTPLEDQLPSTTTKENQGVSIAPTSPED